MPTYLIESYNPGYLEKQSAKGLQKAKTRLQKGIASGKIKGVWARLGGGSVWIVEASSNDALDRRLRREHIKNVKVTPLFDGNVVLDDYIAAKQEAPAKTAG